ncbi:MAG: carbonate dehydratase [Planctomycetia bacterium]|nr:carbonate dehydratase [Planctomycetia bacterium]
MRSLENLLRKNREWAAQRKREDPQYFEKMRFQQNPEYLWIGCSDSRVPANEIVGLQPGELFVHRNVANVVVPSDLNCLSSITYAVNELHVKHVIVCGHYGCGGVKAALDDADVGLTENWLMHIREAHEAHFEEIEAIASYAEKLKRLCEVNVLEQVKNVSRLPVVKQAWKAKRDLTVHGWIYALEEGLIHDLHLKASNVEEAMAMRRLGKEKFRSRGD